LQYWRIPHRERNYIYNDIVHKYVILFFRLIFSNSFKWLKTDLLQVLAFSSVFQMKRARYRKEHFFLTFCNSGNSLSLSCVQIILVQNIRRNSVKNNVQNLDFVLVWFTYFYFSFFQSRREDTASSNYLEFE